MKALKITFIVILSIISVLCVGLDVWYASILLDKPEKSVSQTFKVGLQTLQDGSESPLLQVQLFKNADNSGLAAYEMKWNYLLDENRTSFFSQGTQVIGDFGTHYEYDPSTEIKTDNGKHFGWREEYFSYGGRYVFNDNLSLYDYSSGNNFVDTNLTTNPINDNSLFKITLNIDGENKVYGMKFKGYREIKPGTNSRVRDVPKDIGAEELQVKSHRGRFNQIDAWTDYYYYYDYVWFMQAIYNSIQSLKAGINHNVVFEFGDYFDYYEFDTETNSYLQESVQPDKAAKIAASIKSYYVIQVKINENGLTKSSDSLFNCVNGSQSYNSSENYDDENYFVGRTVKTAYWNNFIFVKIVDNNYALKLKQGFIDYYLKYKDSIRLNVVIDLDYLTKQNIVFVGFTVDSGLDNFVINKCVTTKTVDGHIVENEVSYA